MESLRHQRCYNHRRREAVVLCPVCRRFFCRECVTEHDDRMLCSRCLAGVSGAYPDRLGPWRRRMAGAVQGLLGFLILWYGFLLLGKLLLAIPHAFHEGTIWQADWWLNR